jgi:hypothetical protein
MKHGKDDSAQLQETVAPRFVAMRMIAARRCTVAPFQTGDASIGRGVGGSDENTTPASNEESASTSAQ